MHLLPGNSEDAAVSSQLQRNTDGRVIYRYSYLRLFGGGVLVTDRRLVLGKEAWSIERVQDAEVVPSQMIVSGVPLNRKLIMGSFLGLLLLHRLSY